MLVILFQTGFDLSNAAFCALDGERFGLAGSTNSTVTPSAISASDSEQSEQPAQPVRHIDDCFCCSACVEVQALAPLVQLAILSPVAETLPNRRVLLLSTLFFHPPQLLS